MIDSGYGFAILTALAAVGIYLSMKHNTVKSFIWIMLAAYSLLSFMVQEISGHNGLPIVSGIMSIMVGYICLYLARHYNTNVPLFVSGFMAVIVSSMASYLYLEAISFEFNRSAQFAYQSVTNMMIYFSLLTLILSKGARY